MKKSFFSLFLINCFLGLILSCSQNLPEINSINSTVIFDYENENTAPVIKLSVFTDLESDARRSEKLTVICKSTGYKWECNKPFVFKNGKKNYSGYTDFVMPENKVFQEGQYSLEYEDAAGEVKTSSFSVYFNKEIPDLKASEIEDFMKNHNGGHNLAVYNKDDVLIFYGSVTDDITSEEMIWKRFGSGQSARYVWTLNGTRVMVLLPKINRFSE